MRRANIRAPKEVALSKPYHFAEKNYTDRRLSRRLEQQIVAAAVIETKDCRLRVCAVIRRRLHEPKEPSVMQIITIGLD
jgi:hypothetical protein